MCAASSTTTSSETLRCRPSTTKRGRARPGPPAQRARDPEDHRTESSTSVTAPVPRLRYHSGLGPAAARITPPPARRRRSRRLRPGATRRAGRPRDSSHSRRRGSAHDRGGARRVGVHARGRGDADRPPHRRGRLAGARDRRCDGRRARRAATGARSCSRSPGRRRSRPRAGPRRRGRRGGRRSRGRSSRAAGTGPAVATSPPRLTSVGEPVAAAMAARRAIGGQRLGRRPEIQAASGRRRSSRRRASSSTVRQPAAGIPATASAASAVHRGEVAVVAEGDERRGDGGVHRAPRSARRPAARRARPRVNSALAAHDAPGRVVGAHQLRIGVGSGCTRGRWRRARHQQALRAAQRGCPSTTTTAVVPIASQRRRGVRAAHDPPEVTAGGAGRAGRRAPAAGAPEAAAAPPSPAGCAPRAASSAGRRCPRCVVRCRRRTRSGGARVGAPAPSRPSPSRLPGLVAAASALTLAAASTATVAMTAVIRRSRRSAPSRRATGREPARACLVAEIAMRALSARRVGAS